MLLSELVVGWPFQMTPGVATASVDLPVVEYAKIASYIPPTVGDAEPWKYVCSMVVSSGAVKVQSNAVLCGTVLTSKRTYVPFLPQSFDGPQKNGMPPDVPCVSLSAQPQKLCEAL